MIWATRRCAATIATDFAGCCDSPGQRRDHNKICSEFACHRREPAGVLKSLRLAVKSGDLDLRHCRWLRRTLRIIIGGIKDKWKFALLGIILSVDCLKCTFRHTVICLLYTSDNSHPHFFILLKRWVQTYAPMGAINLSPRCSCFARFPTCAVSGACAHSSSAA